MDVLRVSALIAGEATLLTWRPPQQTVPAIVLVAAGAGVEARIARRVIGLGLAAQLLLYLGAVG